MSHRSARCWGVGVWTGLLLLAWADDAHAIPVFARAYEVPCASCHTAITRRNEFGDVFRRNGYRWPGEAGVDAKARKEPPFAMQGLSLGTGLFPAVLPLGVVASFSGAYSNDPQEEEPLTLGAPSLSLVLGSSLSEHISIFGTWSGKGLPNELYLHLGRFFGRPELNFRVGRFEQWTTLFKNNEALAGRYLITNGAQDGFTLGQSRIGLEANGAVLRRTFWAAGVVRSSDESDFYDGYYHVSQKIGGMDFLGTEPDLDLEDPSAWEDLIVTVGHFGYFGKVAGSDGKVASRIKRVGLDAKVDFRKATLWGGVMLGRDRVRAVKQDNDNLMGFVELSYQVFGWLMPLYMFQLQDAENLKTMSRQHDIGLVILPLENVRARLRVSLNDDNEQNEAAELQLLAGF